jgi:hypothetical protein
MLNLTTGKAKKDRTSITEAISFPGNLRNPEHPIETGRGRVYLRLSPDQYTETLTHGRHALKEFLNASRFGQLPA